MTVENTNFPPMKLSLRAIAQDHFFEIATIIGKTFAPNFNDQNPAFGKSVEELHTSLEKETKSGEPLFRFSVAFDIGTPDLDEDIHDEIVNSSLKDKLQHYHNTDDLVSDCFRYYWKVLRQRANFLYN